MSALRLRKHPLAACLALALAVGAPSAVEGAPPASRASVLEASFAPDSPSDFVTVVANCDDSGPGSLRDAIANTDDGGHVDLRALACSTITLDTAITVDAIDVYLDGPGRDRLTIDGAGYTRLFEGGVGHRLTLTGLHLANGYAAGDGGCILSDGEVSVVDSLVTGCHAHTGPFQARGGAISAAYLRLQESTLRANVVESDSSYAKGGGFYALDTNTFYSTLDSNEARSTFSRGFGGGAFVRRTGAFIGAAVTRNHATNAGGISLVGAAYSSFISESTISGNVADAFIGGVYTRSSGVISNSTIAFNCANQTEVQPGYIAAVGVELFQSYASLVSTIVANNDLCAMSHAPQGSAYDVAARGTAGVTGDHSLVVTSTVPLPPDTLRSDPMLAPLADNGGHGQTHALLAGSPAIDAGYASLAVPWDGRWHWYPRTNGVAADIGAFESRPTGTVRQATTCADSGAGSLRELASVAISGDTIDLTQLACSRITLTSGAIALGLAQSDLTIRGPGSSALTIDGNGGDRIFDHRGPGHLALDGLAFENGSVSDDALGRGGGCIASAGLVIGNDVTFSACAVHNAASPCYGGAILAGAAALDHARISGSRCTSDTDAAAGGGIATDYELALASSTVSDNVAEALGTTSSLGGGIFARREASVRFSTIASNTASIAAAAHVPKLALVDSTVSGNAATLQGGGIAAILADIDNSTIAFNTSPSSGSAAGLFVLSQADLQSAILFGNTDGGSAFDIGTLAGSLFGADNLIGASPNPLPDGTIHDDPLLGPLDDNGGPTKTHALGENSPALDAGNNIASLTTDQRGAGYLRVFNGRADIGAVEMQPEGADTLFANGFD